MRTDMSEWLQGQIEALRKLATVLRDTLECHDKEAAAELRDIEYVCNRITARLKKAAEEKPRKDA